MTQVESSINVNMERISERLEQLRRSFDDDIRHAPPEEDRSTEQFLLLTFSGETYAYPVTHVLEILQVPTIVPVPGVPPAVLGILNFRGQVLSATTIHGVLGMTAGEMGPDNRIVVTKGLPLVTGILVDGVEGIAEVKPDEIQQTPTTVSDDRSRFLTGQVYVDGKLVFLLDVQQLCRSDALRVTRRTQLTNCTAPLSFKKTT